MYSFNCLFSISFMPASGDLDTFRDSNAKDCSRYKVIYISS